MKKTLTSMIFIVLFSCSEEKVIESIFDNEHYNFSHVYIDRGKFNSSYYVLTDKSTNMKKEINNKGYSAFVDSLYIYYYTLGLEGQSYFIDLNNTQLENRFTKDTIASLADYKFQRLDKEFIYKVDNDSLSLFCSVNTAESFDNFPSGKYYIPYPGVLYKSKTKLTDLFIR